MIPAIGSLALPVDETHVWCIDPSDGDPAAWTHLLPRHELAQIAAMPNAQGRDERRCSRALLRAYLSAYHPSPPDSWRFAVGEHGKPALADASLDLRFNVSHTSGMIALAFARGHEVGVDCEGLQRPLPRAEDFVLSAQERSELARLPPDARHERFFELWTLKEALGKGIGTGLALALDALTVAEADGSYRIVGPAAGAVEGWRCGSRRLARHRVSWACGPAHGDPSGEPRVVVRHDPGGTA